MSNVHDLARPAGEVLSPGTVASFAVGYRQFLDPDGRIAGPPPPIARAREALAALYRAMVLTRTFDAKAIALQRTGQLGTYPSCQGQEAVAVGLAIGREGESRMSGAAADVEDAFIPPQ